ncbi:MAG: 23S rRNA (adenine(2503)-C(2))-methyltransferase RlmN [Dehalococcoidia bacterium]|nr:23S rRNA (adenine(2503)-C(2))-methyltransferase RlmN [Dehalococcoidia bacterium]
MYDLLGNSPAELATIFSEWGLSPSAVSRVLKAVYRHGVSSFEKVADISLQARQFLTQSFSINLPVALEECISADGLTHKVLFALEDGNTIETTLMLSQTSAGREHGTVCISSQVGCAVGCPFCITGRQGFTRNLTTGEIVGQVLFFQRRFCNERQTSHSLTNIVFMGMGEPLLNYDNVRRAAIILNSPQGMGFSMRKIMLSTAGITPRICQLASDNTPVELAFSLHAVEDELRDILVPLNVKYPLAELLSACQEYSFRTGRLVYVEYAMFAGVNDSLKDAEKLIKLLKGIPCALNLIIGNDNGQSGYLPSGREAVLAFQKLLITGGIRTMLRVPRGIDICAGCGQLRSRLLATYIPVNHNEGGSTPSDL